MNDDRQDRLDRIIAGYLSEIDAGQPPDRLGILRQHPDLADDLASFFAAQDEVDALAEPFKAGPAPSGASSVPELAPGDEIGRYRVEAILGSGGFGTVYLARDPVLGRPVAIKVSRPERASVRDSETMVAEARHAARLRHPSIVAVHDVGLDSERGERCYVVMEYVPGRTLAQVLESAGGKFAPARAATLAAEVAEAVHHAHRHSLIHRDLKPSNILIDDRGRPLVTDFGLAVHEDGQRLKAGEIAGTPAYMAPEQVRGETHRLDGRTDIWALGVLLYEMLTGRRPFTGRTPAEVFDEIEHREARPPRQLDDTIPRELERICLKCLAKRVRDRYSTAADVADDLRAWLRTTSDVIEPVPPTPLPVQARVEVRHVEPVSMLHSGFEPLAAKGTPTRRRRRFRPALLLASLLALLAVVAVGRVAVNTLEASVRAWAPTPWNIQLIGPTAWTYLSGTEGSFRFRVASGIEGRALSVQGLPVDVTLSGPEGPIKLVSVRTDGHGTAQPMFRLPAWPEGTYTLTLTLNPPGGSPETVTQQVSLTRASSLMVSTDKPLYQPGQTIHARVLALRQPDRKPLAGSEAVLTVTDPKDNVILRKRGPTSRFGIASLDCPIAAEARTGTYKLECKVGDVSRTVEVEVAAYVLPKFRVDVSLDRTFYTPNSKPKASVRAGYTFGKPVEGGDVRIAVRARKHNMVLVEKRGKTAADGRAEFDFDFFSFDVKDELDVVAEVTDTAGQTYKGVAQAPLTPQPLTVDAWIEGGTFLEGIANRVYIAARWVDGSPAADARITATGGTTVRTDADGLAMVELSQGYATGLFVKVDAATRDGYEASDQTRLLAPSANSSLDFVLRTDRALYRAGETVKLQAFSTSEDAPLFVDLVQREPERDGRRASVQTLATLVMKATREGAGASLTLPADRVGQLDLVAYRLGAGGVAVRKTRGIGVLPTKRLGVEAKLDRPEYRPGGTASLSLQLTDEDGRPTPGAVSLAAVDRALLALKAAGSSAIGTEPAFFLGAALPWSVGNEARSDARALVRMLQEQQVETSIGKEWHVRSSYDEKAREVQGRQQVRLTALAEWRETIETGLYVGLGLILAAFALPVLWRVLAAAIRSARCRPRSPLFDFAFLGLLIFMAGIMAIGFLSSNIQTTFNTAASTMGGMDRNFPAPTAEAAIPKSEDRFPPMAMRGTDDPGAKGTGGAPEPPRVRELFPETLLWRPELVTDDNGRATLEIPLADSITTWQLAAGAVDVQGRLGGLQTDLRVFQPFQVDVNLPVALIRGDEIAVPVVVHNDLDRAQKVTIRFKADASLEMLDEPDRTLDLEPGAVRSVSYRIRARKVGSFPVEVIAQGEGEGAADAVRRRIEVRPDGRKIEKVVNGVLRQPLSLDLEVPPEAIEGSVRAEFKIYPTAFSQLVAGLEGIFRMPYGCFEQTSSTTYPNVLALDYLKRTNTSNPEVEQKAKELVHLGYQRLLSFEIPGGGFDWFGRPPANRLLTAYGLMEFRDMAKVYDVDPRLIERTRRWLLDQRRPDGSWQPESHRLHEDVGRTFGPLAEARLTAYIAWAVFEDMANDPAAEPTRAYLRQAVSAAKVEDAYTLALLANAWWALDPSGKEALPYADKLVGLVPANERLPHWGMTTSTSPARTCFYGHGRAAEVETTALAALALLRSGEHAKTAMGALEWLTAHRDPGGTWGSTQATVLALKALLAATDAPAGDGQARRVEVAVDTSAPETISIPADESDVVRTVDLTRSMTVGTHRLAAADVDQRSSTYQVVFSYFVPDEGERAADARNRGLGVDLTLDRTEAAPGQAIGAKATVRVEGDRPAPMVIVELPVPAGFAADTSALEKRIAEGDALDKLERTPSIVRVYCRGIDPEKPLELSYALQSTTTARVTVAPARAYEYYDPDRVGTSAPASLVVK